LLGYNQGIEMKNPLDQLKLFPTPKNPDELADILNSIGSPDEVRIAWQAAAMAVNMSWHMVQTEIDAEHA
jgi:hypothetical protein